jgi:uncharacterized protein (UPF0332 family)
VTPEAQLFLDKARLCLTHAEAILRIDLGDEAGRAAYLTAFHAAQAFIHERTGREAKTHQGVRSQFLLLTKDDPRVRVELRRFLSQAYDLKSVADYATGPDAFVPLDQAAAAIVTARRFLDCVVALLDMP